jgi:large subunit ribosomal protein L21
MFAVIQIGSSQFKVTEGDSIETNRLDSEVGKDIALDNVLVYAKDADVRVGQPFLKDVKVKAKVVNHKRGAKVIAFKYRRTKDSACKKGHRQELTTLSITKISA